jgi:prepilin peptidase dependent protein A
LSSVVHGCVKESAFVLIPLWADVAITELTPSLGFYGLRDTAWAGRIRVKSRAGEWLIMVSNGGRIRMCNASEVGGCQ